MIDTRFAANLVWLRALRKKEELIIVKIAKFFLLIAVLWLGLPPLVSGEPLPEFQIMTENWQPYQYKENGEIRGASVDLLVEMLARLGSDQGRKDIKMYDWARAYSVAKSKKNSILFLTTKTPDREGQFKWVGPLFNNSWVLIGKKSKNLKVGLFDKIKSYHVGTVIDDFSEEYLQNLGLKTKNFCRSSTYQFCVKMLAEDGVDLVFMSWETFSIFAGKENIDINNYEAVFTIESYGLYYAFNKLTPAWIIERFQNAFVELKEQGRVGELLHQYRAGHN